SSSTPRLVDSPSSTGQLARARRCCCYTGFYATLVAGRLSLRVCRIGSLLWRGMRRGQACRPTRPSISPSPTGRTPLMSFSTPSEWFALTSSDSPGAGCLPRSSSDSTQRVSITSSSRTPMRAGEGRFRRIRSSSGAPGATGTRGDQGGRLWRSGCLRISSWKLRQRWRPRWRLSWRTSIRSGSVSWPGLSVKLSELVASLSIGTDIGMGQPEGQALRTCLLALGVAREMGLDHQQCADVYYVALLRFVGCNSHADQDASSAGGDEMAFRR